VDKDNCLVRLPSILYSARSRCLIFFWKRFQTLPHHDELVPELTVSMGHSAAGLGSPGYLTRVFRTRGGSAGKRSGMETCWSSATLRGHHSMTLEEFRYG